MSSGFKQPFDNLRERSDLRKDFEKLTMLHELQLGHKMALSGYYENRQKDSQDKTSQEWREDFRNYHHLGN